MINDDSCNDSDDPNETRYVTDTPSMEVTPNSRTMQRSSSADGLALWDAKEEDDLEKNSSVIV